MKGILFKPDMIKAIAENRKTQTRRLGGLKEINKEPDDWQYNGWAGSWQGYAFNNLTKPYMSKIIKPRYQVGEVVYIKEAWRYLDATARPRVEREESPLIQYKLDSAYNKDWSGACLVTDNWRSPLFMPAWAARYFREITDIRAERLQEITLADIRAEGITDTGTIPVRTAMLATETHNLEDLQLALGRADYASLWNSINPKHLWASNPFVWRYELKGRGK